MRLIYRSILTDWKICATIQHILAKPAITTPTYTPGIKNTKHEQTCQAERKSYCPSVSLWLVQTNMH